MAETRGLSAEHQETKSQANGTQTISSTSAPARLNSPTAPSPRSTSLGETSTTIDQDSTTFKHDLHPFDTNAKDDISENGITTGTSGTQQEENSLMPSKSKSNSNSLKINSHVSKAAIENVVTMTTHANQIYDSPKSHRSVKTIDLNSTIGSLNSSGSCNDIRSEVQHFMCDFTPEPHPVSQQSHKNITEKIIIDSDPGKSSVPLRSSSLLRDPSKRCSVEGAELQAAAASRNGEKLSRFSYSADTSPNGSPTAIRKIVHSSSVNNVVNPNQVNPLDTISAAMEMIHRQAESVNSMTINSEHRKSRKHKHRKHAKRHHLSLDPSLLDHANRRKLEALSSRSPTATDSGASRQAYPPQRMESVSIRAAAIKAQKANRKAYQEKIRPRDLHLSKKSNQYISKSGRVYVGDVMSPPPEVPVKRMPDAIGPISPPPALEVRRVGVPPSPPQIIVSGPVNSCGIPKPKYPVGGITVNSGLVWNQQGFAYNPNLTASPFAASSATNTVPRLAHHSKDPEKARHRHSDAGLANRFLERRPSAFQPYQEVVTEAEVFQMQTRGLTTSSTQDSTHILLQNQNTVQIVPLNDVPQGALASPAETEQSSSILDVSNISNGASKAVMEPAVEPVENETPLPCVPYQGKRRKSFMDTLPAIFIDNEASEWGGSRQDLNDITEENINSSSSKQQQQSKTSADITNFNLPSTRFPLKAQASVIGSEVESATVEAIIQDLSPDLTLKPIKPLTVSNVHRMSQYDNMSGLLGLSRPRAPASSSGTCYCMPWDSRPWQDMMSGSKGGLDLLAGFTHISCGASAAQTSALTSDEAVSEVEYSSLAPAQSPVPSEAKTNLVSELATSFEWTGHDFEKDLDWQHPGDYDSATDTMPNCSSPMMASPEPGAWLEVASSMPSSMPADILPQSPSLLNAHNSAMSEDEGVGNEEDFGTDSFRKRLKPLIMYPSPQEDGFYNLKGARLASFRLRDYIDELARDDETTFGKTVQHFIQCTVEAQERNPQVVIRNVRQFMNGIKNYLVSSGEEKLNRKVEQERCQLQADEFMNVDAIIEGALHKCIIQPLNQHLYWLFVEEYKGNGKLQLLSDSIKQARNLTPPELGIPAEFPPPQGSEMEVVKYYLALMQNAYSPLKKLEHLLSATNTLYNSAQSHSNSSLNQDRSAQLGVDGSVALLMFVLVDCGLVSAEIESDYMWGLLHPCLLAGEGGYCLSTLSSAINLLKNLRSGPMSIKGTLSLKSIPSVCGNPETLLKICIPDEKNDLLITKTMPVRPNMTARDVCSMIAHKYKITNPQDYGLFLLVSGSEERLSDMACPQAVQLARMAEGQLSVFAFKRSTAKFVWPTTLRC